MTAGAPWSVKGIDPKAREVAKDLARRSGMTLGEWLNHVILEDDAPEEVTSESDFLELERPRRPAEPPRVRLAAVGPADRPEDLVRVAQALDRLTDRIEASETRTGLAIAGIEHSVRQAVDRIDAAERETLAVSARLDDDGERLRRVENEISGPRSLEALRGIYGEAGASGAASGLVEEVVARLGDRLIEAEARTTQALEGLRGSLAGLDARLRSVEAGSTVDVDRRLEAMAADLSMRIEAARAEAVAGLEIAAPGAAPGAIDRRLAQMADHISAAEQRSARAVETMGREVLALAEALNKRLLSTEQQSSAALEQVGGEIARIGAAVESRLSRTEQAQSDALQKLGADIGRVTERLTDRIMQSERRAAQAIDDVGEQVARVTERMELRHERIAGDFAERIRQSEERTARLLDEARAGLRARAEDVQETTARITEAAADDPPPVHPFGAELFARAETESGVSVTPTFAPIADPDAEALLEDDAGVEERRPLSTREVIEQARLAARAAAAAGNGPQPTGARRAAGRPGARRTFAGLGFRTNVRPHSTWQTALMLAGGAAFLSVGAAGVVLMEGQPGSRLPQVVSALPPGSAPRAAVALSPQGFGPAAPVSEAADSGAPAPGAAEYAAAVRDLDANQAGALARLKAVADAGYAPAQFYLAKLYESGEAGVVKNAAEARRWTARAADGGDRSAMHNLALYYFRGEGGPQDLAVAATWFHRAAEAGVGDSQYNLGLLYQAGSGVKRDLAEAYKWFSIAAQGGDAQARANAQALEPTLAPAVLAAADKAVAAFRPRGEFAAPAQAPTATSVAAAQRILGRLGYYSGPISGEPSPDLKVAVLNYQRDHGLPATGMLDPDTRSQLSVFAR